MKKSDKNKAMLVLLAAIGVGAFVAMTKAGR